jgi:hypothetical protein
MSHSVAKVIYAQYAGKADLLTKLLPNCFSTLCAGMCEKQGGMC